MKKYLTTGLKIVVSAVLVGYVVSSVDIIKVIEISRNIQYSYIFLAVLLLIINYFFSALRWFYLNLDGKISFIYMLKLYFIGTFFNNFLPTSIGGDGYKIYKLGQKLGSTTHAFTATFLERFIGMLTLILLSVYGFFVFSSNDILFMLLSIFGLILSFIVFLIYYPKFTFKPPKLQKLFGILDKIHDSFKRYYKFPKILAISFGLSFLVQFASIFSQYFIFKSIGITIPMDFSLFAFPLIFISGYAIPSLNGIGSQDFLYTTFFQQVGVLAEFAVSASIFYHILRLGVSLIGGFLYVNEK